VMAFSGTRLIASYLANVSPITVPVLAACGAAMLLIAVIAACIPALRACRVDPLTALRPD